MELFDFLMLIKKLLFMKRDLAFKDLFDHMAPRLVDPLQDRLGEQVDSLGSAETPSPSLCGAVRKCY